MKATLALGIVALAALAAGASAQPAPPAPATKKFGEFVVRCTPGPSVAPCDMYEERGDKDTGRRVLSMSIGFMPSASRYIMQIAVPLGISIEKGVVVESGKFVSPALPFRRCDQAGCYVETGIDKTLIDAFAQADKDAKIRVVGDDGKAYGFTFSFDGFGAADDDMVAENKAKATAAPAPATP